MWRKRTRPTPPNSPRRLPRTYAVVRTSPRPYKPCSASRKSATPQPNHGTFALRINKSMMRFLRHHLEQSGAGVRAYERVDAELSRLTETGTSREELNR